MPTRDEVLATLERPEAFLAFDPRTGAAPTAVLPQDTAPGPTLALGGSAQPASSSPGLGRVARGTVDTLQGVGSGALDVLQAVGGDFLRAHESPRLANLVDPGGRETAFTEIGKAELDFRSGLITKDQRDQIVESRIQSLGRDPKRVNVLDREMRDPDTGGHLIRGMSLDRALELTSQFPDRFAFAKDVGPPDTQVSQSIGDIELSTGAKTELEKTIISNFELLDVSRRIAESFDPEFLTYYGQGRQGLLNFVDRTPLRGILTEEDRESIRNASRFEQSTITLVNATIRAITGAQMSQGEAERIKTQVPNLDDPPEKFKEKLRNSRITLALAAIRAQELRTQGITKDFWRHLSLDSMKNEILSEADRVFAQTKRERLANGMQDAAAKEAAYQEAQQYVSRRFGGVDLIELRKARI